MEWGMKNLGVLFCYSDSKDHIMQKVYILTKRLHGMSDVRVLTMPAEDRDTLYEMEMKLINYENEQAKKGNQQNEIE